MAYSNSWVPLTRTSALGVVPILEHSIDLDDFGVYKPDRRLRINVSGVHFEVNLSTVERFPTTLLGSDERDYFYDYDADEYFFDRDPELFRYILSYYQSGKLHFPKHVCASAFEDELKFYSILTEHLSDCCYEDYIDRCRDIQSQAAHLKESVMHGPQDELTFREKLWHIFENPEGTNAAIVVYYTTGFFIIISVLSNMAETIPYNYSEEYFSSITYGDAYGNVFFCLDTACVVIFTIEYIARLYAAPARFEYIRSIMALIDLVAVLPYYIGLIVPSNMQFSGSLVTLRVFRVFRIFKFSRHSQGLRILGYTLKSCAQELGFLLFSLTLVVIIFATVIYYIEKFDEETSFYSIPAASWYTIVTMTTLGYGDMVPSTVLGKIIGSICSLCGVLVIALPVPVIVSNFSRIYQQNQRLNRHLVRHIKANHKIQYAQKFNQPKILETDNQNNQDNTEDNNSSTVLNKYPLKDITKSPNHVTAFGSDIKRHSFTNCAPRLRRISRT